MDPKTQQPSATQQAAGNPAAQPNPVVAQMPQGNGGDQKKLVLWFISGLVLIILIVGGVYWYLTSKQVQVPQSQISAPPKIQENLEAELDALDVMEVDAQFTTVDKDLQGL